jgi:hypothetical protein
VAAACCSLMERLEVLPSMVNKMQENPRKP